MNPVTAVHTAVEPMLPPTTVFVPWLSSGRSAEGAKRGDAAQVIGPMQACVPVVNPAAVECQRVAGEVLDACRPACDGDREDGVGRIAVGAVGVKVATGSARRTAPFPQPAAGAVTAKLSGPIVAASMGSLKVALTVRSADRGAAVLRADRGDGWRAGVGQGCGGEGPDMAARRAARRCSQPTCCRRSVAALVTVAVNKLLLASTAPTGPKVAVRAGTE